MTHFYVYVFLYLKRRLKPDLQLLTVGSTLSNVFSSFLSPSRLLQLPFPATKTSSHPNILHCL